MDPELPRPDLSQMTALRTCSFTVVTLHFRSAQARLLLPARATDPRAQKGATRTIPATVPSCRLQSRSIIHIQDEHEVGPDPGAVPRIHMWVWVLASLTRARSSLF